MSLPGTYIIVNEQSLSSELPHPKTKEKVTTKRIEDKNSLMATYEILDFNKKRRKKLSDVLYKNEDLRNKVSISIGKNAEFNVVVSDIPPNLNGLKDLAEIDEVFGFKDYRESPYLDKIDSIEFFNCNGFVPREIISGELPPTRENPNENFVKEWDIMEHGRHVATIYLDKDGSYQKTNFVGPAVEDF